MPSVMDEYDGGESISEIDSYVNMVVVGKIKKILEDTGDKVDMIPIIPGYQALEKV